MARSKIREEYMKARRALQRKISSFKKKGYTVPENYVPSIPKRVTEGSIRRIENLFRGITERATYTTEKGEVLTGKRAKVARQRETKREKARRERGYTHIDTETGEFLEGDYDTEAENIIPIERYQAEYIDNYLSQFEGSAFGNVLEKTLKEKLADKIMTSDLEKALQQLERTDYAPSRESRYDLESAIMEVEGFIRNFNLFDEADAFNLREAFSDDEMLMMGMEFERTRSDYKNHQRAVRYASMKYGKK